MDYSMEVSVLGDRISIGEEAHVITLGVNTGFPAGSTAGLAYTLSPLQARVLGAQMRAAADAAEGHPGMPSDEEVNAAAKVFCGGVWNGFDPASMMPTDQFDRFWGDGEGHQLYLEIARHALTAAIAASGIAAEAEALANRQADMAAKERRETRLTILAAISIIGIIVAHVVIHR